MFYGIQPKEVTETNLKLFNDELNKPNKQNGTPSISSRYLFINHRMKDDPGFADNAQIFFGAQEDSKAYYNINFRQWEHDVQKFYSMPGYVPEAKEQFVVKPKDPTHTMNVHQGSFYKKNEIGRAHV